MRISKVVEDTIQQSLRKDYKMVTISKLLEKIFF